jgi:methionyl-tRNA formyltransferase
MSGKSNATVLFLGKKNDWHCQRAVNFIHDNFKAPLCHLGDWNEPMPDDVHAWEGDYIISYLSRWVVPASVISKAQRAAINFHPASPDYPGIGCNNFALYEEAKEYGVTCHHMAARVDTGDIIAVKRFPVFQTDTVSTLLSRTYDFQLVLFYEVMGRLVDGQTLTQSEEKWARKPFSRKEFNRLRVISPDMTLDEIRKRVRATSYGVWQPHIEIGGFVFALDSDTVARSDR